MSATDKPREPRWLQALRKACATEGRRVVAARIRYSEAVISQVLNGRYTGRTDKVREAVEGALLGATVECPVLGDLSRAVCLDHQRRPFAATNPQRVALYRACRDGCPHSHAPRPGLQGGTES